MCVFVLVVAQLKVGNCIRHGGSIVNDVVKYNDLT